MSAVSFSKVASLIRGYSMPNTDLWTLLPGKVKKTFNNYAKAQAYIAKRHQTDTDEPSKLSCVLKYTFASTCVTGILAWASLIQAVQSCFFFCFPDKNTGFSLFWRF